MNGVFYVKEINKYLYLYNCTIHSKEKKKFYRCDVTEISSLIKNLSVHCTKHDVSVKKLLL